MTGRKCWLIGALCGGIALVIMLVAWLSLSLHDIWEQENENRQESREQWLHMEQDRNRRSGVMHWEQFWERQFV